MANTDDVSYANLPRVHWCCVLYIFSEEVFVWEPSEEEQLKRLYFGTEHEILGCIRLVAIN